MCSFFSLPFCLSIFNAIWIAILTVYKNKTKIIEKTLCNCILNTHFWRLQPKHLKCINVCWCWNMLNVCSVSLSSLDSEEQESLRAERLHNRTSRNSTGGISTHSLNEAELAVCIIQFVPFFFITFLILLMICPSITTVLTLCLLSHLIVFLFSNWFFHIFLFQIIQLILNIK